MKAVPMLLVAAVAIGGGGTAGAKPRPAADVSVTIVAAADPVAAGRTAEWTVTAANKGPSRAAAVVVLVRLAGEAEDVAGTGRACGVRGTTVTCRLGALAKGARAAVGVTAKATAAGPLTAFAAVSARTRDPRRRNNTLSLVTRVLGPDTVQGHGVRPTYRPGGGSPFRVSVDIDATSAFDGGDATGTFATRYPNGDPDLRGHVVCLKVEGNRARVGGIIDTASGSNVAATPPGSGVLLDVTDNGDPGVGHDTQISYIGTPVDDARNCALGDQSVELPLTDGNFTVHDEHP